ncbi:MAG TPA: alpha/beta hydrolase [Caulobacteraceae bacterium]
MSARVHIALAAAMLAGAGVSVPSVPASPTPLMDWPDLLGRPMPAATKRIRYGDKASQFADLWLPDAPGPHPVVVMVHGGCWRSKIAKLTIMNYAAEDLRRRGIAVWNIEYRGVDQAGGGYPGTFADVAAAADALRGVAQTYRLELKNTVAFGHSAGGHLAMWLAARPRLPPSSLLASRDPLPIAAVISSGGLPDLKADRSAKDAACGAEVIGLLTGAPSPGRSDVYADTSPAERLPIGVRQEIVNGRQDPIAPPWLGAHWTDRARSAGDDVRLTIIESTGHVELISPGAPAWSREVEMIERWLRSSPNRRGPAP